MRRWIISAVVSVFVLLVSASGSALDPSDNDGYGRELLACWHESALFTRHVLNLADDDGDDSVGGMARYCSALLGAGVQSGDGEIFYRGNVTSTNYRLTYEQYERAEFLCDSTGKPVSPLTARVFLRHALTSDTALNTPVTRANPNCYLQWWTRIRSKHEEREALACATLFRGIPLRCATP